MSKISFENLGKKENRFPDHTITAVGTEYVEIRQPGYATGTYDLGSLGDAILNCPDDMKRFVVLDRAYSFLLKMLAYID